MKIQLLIATADSDYAGHLSDTLSSKYSDTFEVGVCSSAMKLGDALLMKKYDVMLIEPEWVALNNAQNVRLVIALLGGQASFSEELSGINKAHKYQRISTLVGTVLEQYAAVATDIGFSNNEGGRIVAVWSPVGGVGKTSVALAFATRAASGGVSATYLNLENFAGSGAYFSGQGKSISTFFEKLESNPEILAKSIRQHDSGSGIDYFIPPENYDDINELTRDDLLAVVKTCSFISDMVVVDLPSVCDKKTQAVLEIADTVLLVADGSKTSAAKFDIFLSQHNVFEDIRPKARLVANKGSKFSDARFERTISLPLVQTADPVSVYKSLSGYSLGE